MRQIDYRRSKRAKACFAIAVQLQRICIDNLQLEHYAFRLKIGLKVFYALIFVATFSMSPNLKLDKLMMFQKLFLFK